MKKSLKQHIAETNPRYEPMPGQTPRFKVGDMVHSWQSGKPYIITEVVIMDMVGTYGYRVRGLRQGALWGPTRFFGETTINMTEDDMARKQAFIGRVFFGTD